MKVWTTIMAFEVLKGDQDGLPANKEGISMRCSDFAFARIASTSGSASRHRFCKKASRFCSSLVRRVAV